MIISRIKLITAGSYCFLSPWTKSVELLESTVSPSLKLALHWMLVLLYSTDVSLKTSVPRLDSWLNSVSTLVRLRSSSCVPFISHSTLVIVVLWMAWQLNVGLLPEKVTRSTEPLEDLSVTRNHRVNWWINNVCMCLSRDFFWRYIKFSITENLDYFLLQ